MSGNIKSAEILCVGTELLLGDIVNTNAAFLSQELAKLGICVYRHTVVGDNTERLKTALSSALEGADMVITSGGLGPTYDDLTKETVAEYFGREMKLDERSLGRIEEYFKKTGRVMTENNRKQAVMPEGAVIFDNDYGTAPALALCGGENDSKTVVMLPGPPSEIVPIFKEKVLPYLAARCDGVIVSRNVHIFGMGESAVESAISDIMKNSTNPTVAPYCQQGEVRLRVTASAKSEKEALDICDNTISRILESEVGKYIYGIDIDSLERAVVEFLRKNKLTLACAESCTGGLTAKRITDVSGSSDVFLGGCVTYANEAKMKLIGVSSDTLERFGAVSEKTAAEMARGVREALSSDIGVSITGIAGPSGGTPDKPVGTVFVGISTSAGERVRALSLSPMRSREYIRTVSSSNALDMILKNRT
ncbi:MAG: competence/damage-inducible protein A [Clostridia bacterium]|nr:competence/damage-inducible protein A [Clostridia bacterium]